MHFIIQRHERAQRSIGYAGNERLPDHFLFRVNFNRIWFCSFAPLPQSPAIRSLLFLAGQFYVSFFLLALYRALNAVSIWKRLSDAIASPHRRTDDCWTVWAQCASVCVNFRLNKQKSLFIFAHKYLSIDTAYTTLAHVFLCSMYVGQYEVINCRLCRVEASWIGMQSRFMQASLSCVCVCVRRCLLLRLTAEPWVWNGPNNRNAGTIKVHSLLSLPLRARPHAQHNIAHSLWQNNCSGSKCNATDENWNTISGQF